MSFAENVIEVGVDEKGYPVAIPSSDLQLESTKRTPNKEDNITSNAMVDNTSSDKVLHGKIDAYISPLYTNWRGAEAYNGVNRIGLKIINANNLNTNINFKVITQEDANAYTQRDNTITVQTGILAFVEQEDELAAILAHELGHVKGNHVQKATMRSVGAAALGVTGSVFTIIGAFKDDKDKSDDNKGSLNTFETIGAITTLSGSVVELANNKFDRGNEYNADLQACDMCVKAGYNPLALISLLNKIGGNYFDFFADHPSTDKRIKNIYNHVRKNYPQFIQQGFDSLAYERALIYVENK